MNFRIEASDLDTPWAGTQIDLVCAGASDIQRPIPDNQIYDVARRVTWVHNGRAYEAMIGRVAVHGQIG